MAYIQNFRVLQKLGNVKRVRKIKKLGKRGNAAVACRGDRGRCRTHLTLLQRGQSAADHGRAGQPHLQQQLHRRGVLQRQCQGLAVYDEAVVTPRGEPPPEVDRVDLVFFSANA